MIRTLIIEDETAAARNLQVVLGEMYPQLEIVATVESVEDSCEWLEQNPMPDLVFMDIHLADGNAFRIFDKTTISCPIIFTTAYDQYALEAFRVNSIDYILKPLKKGDVERAVGKFLSFTAPQRDNYAQKVVKMVAEDRRNTTLLVQIKDRIIPIEEGQIAFFHTSDEKVSVTTMEGKTFPVDGTLESLYTRFAGKEFYRANRQFIISRKAIKDISVWFGSRLAVNLSVATPERIIISKARTSDFKGWLA